MLTRTLCIGLATLALGMNVMAKSSATGKTAAPTKPAAATAAPAAPKPATPPMPTFTEGVEYERVDSSAANALAAPVSPAGSIEVMEFFSYGCVHCFHFEPMVEGWRKLKPADVKLVLVPATFRPDFALLARGYYASEALGVSEKVHAAIWDALWKQTRRVDTIADLIDLYQSVGVDRAKFVDACAAPAIEERLKHAGELLVQYGVRGTPDLIVARKYRVLLGKLPNAGQAFEVANYLIGMERSELKTAHVANHL